MPTMTTEIIFTKPELEQLVMEKLISLGKVNPEQNFSIVFQNSNSSCVKVKGESFSFPLVEGDTPDTPYPQDLLVPMADTLTAPDEDTEPVITDVPTQSDIFLQDAGDSVQTPVLEEGIEDTLTTLEDFSDSDPFL